MKDSAGWNRTRCRAWIDGSPSALSDGTLKVAEPQPADCDVNIDHSRVESAPPSFAIADRRVGADEPVFVIAEVGINHGGDAALCARMMEAAAAAGADAVKLQTIDADESYVKGTLSYNEFNGKEISDEALAGLLRLADRLRLVLFSTPGDFVSLERMTRLGMAAVKISSGLMTNLPLIAAAARHVRLEPRACRGSMSPRVTAVGYRRLLGRRARVGRGAPRRADERVGRARALAGAARRAGARHVTGTSHLLSSPLLTACNRRRPFCLLESDGEDAAPARGAVT